MKLAFLLHLYQPPTQTAQALKTVVNECYLPLIKLIKSKTDTKYTLNVPLSLLELLDTHGYNDVLEGLRDLADSEKVEFTGSAAYHPLLTKTPEEYSYKQIVLNEYGLGYYFGQRHGFEGEISILVKDVKGFFPPELAINSAVLNVLDDLKYEWTVVDPSALRKTVGPEVPFGVFSLNDCATKLVVRDSNLSNMLSFKRDAEIGDIIEYVKGQKDNKSSMVAALDGEVFGHHNKEGIYLLDSLIDELKQLDVAFTTVSESIEDEALVKVSGVAESNWSIRENESSFDMYSLWQSKGNKIQSKFWQLQDLTSKVFAGKTAPKVEEGYENTPIWLPNSVKSISNIKTKEFISTELLVLKSMHSDQFWWASKETIFDKYLYGPLMLRNALDIYTQLAETPFYTHKKTEILQMISEINLLIDE